MENEQNVMGNCVQKPNESDDENSTRNSQMNNQVKITENVKPIVNHEDTLEVFYIFLCLLLLSSWH